ncbi:unnamed protein product [Prorocentrum cordatum]|uniref:Secreted protein n=1 Tax=Prorocentrum cordatum TaxID=2364126 RepID=A0ABN9UYU9_9DINO|nr:unnamed protein product [Polarella glacialis]
MPSGQLHCRGLLVQIAPSIMMSTVVPVWGYSITSSVVCKIRAVSGRRECMLTLTAYRDAFWMVPAQTIFKPMKWSLRTCSSMSHTCARNRMAVYRDLALRALAFSFVQSYGPRL